MPLPVSDGVVTVRPFATADQQVVLDGRDEAWERWLGPGSSDPAPMACIEVAGRVIGWIDVDVDQPWLEPGESNVGYSIFPAHRGHGYAARALRLLMPTLVEHDLHWALLVIDLENGASLGVARAAGAQRRVDRSMPQFPTSVVYGIEVRRS